MRTHGDVIVLPHWETKLPAPWPAIPLRHIILTLSQPVLPYPNNAECQTRKRQAPILKSSVWLNHVSNLQAWGSNLWSSDYPISQNGRWALYSFGHPDWFQQCPRCTFSVQINSTHMTYMYSVYNRFKLNINITVLKLCHTGKHNTRRSKVIAVRFQFAAK